MLRVWLIWLVFVLCLAVGAVGLGWVSLTALRLDRAEAQAQRRAALQENVRLALWRMDSGLAPFIAQENGRPYFMYRALYPAERAYSRMYSPLQAQEVLIPSPLLTFESPWVRLHFQIGPDGVFSSPQVPMGNVRDVAEMGLRTFDRIEEASTCLNELQKRVTCAELTAKLPQDPAAETITATPPRSASPKYATQGKQRLMEEAQQELNVSEQQSRAQMYQNTILNPNAEPAAQQGGKQQGAPQLAVVREGTLRALWLGETLLLVRRVEADRRTYIQGCWLNWPAIRLSLLALVKDLLPAAHLAPAAEGGAVKNIHQLAAMPVLLFPGELPEQRDGRLTPVQYSLLLVWGAALLAALIIGLVLGQAVTLSERRGAFVSAVTHELRTPLTTFRLYTDLLREGALDEAKRGTYLETLRREADRLSHLVENVLAYARLERRKYGTRVEVTTLEALLERARERLADRAAQAGMELQVAVPPAAAACTLRTDAGVVEQILYNLVDNACKYAVGAERKAISLEAAAAGPWLTMRVRDYGPGIADSRRLFRPFCKSARQAAESAPGVGLGLALSRRLARALGGELRWDRSVTDGACFELRLPVQRQGIGGSERR